MTGAADQRELEIMRVAKVLLSLSWTSQIF